MILAVHRLYVFVLQPSLFPLRGGRAQVLAFKCKIDKADFTDRIYFVSSYIMEEITPKPEVLKAN